MVLLVVSGAAAATRASALGSLTSSPASAHMDTAILVCSPPCHSIGSVRITTMRFISGCQCHNVSRPAQFECCMFKANSFQYDKRWKEYKHACYLLAFCPGDRSRLSQMCLLILTQSPMHFFSLNLQQFCLPGCARSGCSRPCSPMCTGKRALRLTFRRPAPVFACRRYECPSYLPRQHRHPTSIQSKWTCKRAAAFPTQTGTHHVRQHLLYSAVFVSSLERIANGNVEFGLLVSHDRFWSFQHLTRPH